MHDLFSSNGGEIACTNHMGGYASAALKQNPDVEEIITPLDVWWRITESENEEWVRDFKKDMKCETCGKTFTQAKREV